MTNTTTINGRAVTNTTKLHALWASFLDTQERFESGRPVASNATRMRLMVLAATLESTVKAAWDNRKADAFGAKVAMNRMVRLETELGGFAADAPIREDFSTRTSGWVYDPNADRLDGDDFDLLASAKEAAAEAIALRFELHRVRKSTTNRVSLAKLGLVPRFSWSAAWSDTKAQMRELGAEIRANESWARQVERELVLRGREADEFNRGVTECDADYDLPSEDDQRCWSARDLAEMSR